MGEAAKRSIGIGLNQVPDMFSFSSQLEINGYQLLPGGIIIQWGQTPRGASSPAIAMFPIPFPRLVLCVVGSIYDDVNPQNVTIRRKTPTSSTLLNAQFFLNGGTDATSINWIAIGK